MPTAGPTMVDVSDKTATKRTAVAEARVHFPAAVAAALRDSGLRSSKGPIFDTAIVAGVMGAKRTHELIPFCHPLGIESCLIAIELEGSSAVIRCTVSVHHKTGVEMEALTGASVAALTDLRHVQGVVPRHRDLRCEALGKGWRQEQIPPRGSTMTDGPTPASRSRGPAAPPVFGLVLAGGSSSRMQRDKAVLEYRGKSQIERAVELAAKYLPEVFVSVRAGQAADPSRARYPLIVDSVPGEGPIVGIRSALAARPGVAWLVLACDLPFLSDAALSQLLAERDPGASATAFRSAHDGLPEPLCAIWEPKSAAELAAYQAADGRCPRKFLIRHGAKLLEPRDRRALDNINTPDEYREALRSFDAEASAMQLNIQYYALMREQAGRSDETLETTAATPADLYSELKARYGFTLPREQLKVAVNSEFASWSQRLACR